MQLFTLYFKEAGKKIGLKKRQEAMNCEGTPEKTKS